MNLINQKNKLQEKLEEQHYKDLEHQMNLDNREKFIEFSRELYQKWEITEEDFQDVYYENFIKWKDIIY